MKYIFISLVKFYRRFISPNKPSCCRFIPTCSTYALEAFEERGAIIGFGLTVGRICRCNPFCKGGYDPVPKARSKMAHKARKNNKDRELLSDKAQGRK